ncbi:unnamed protein product [Protopolystoma xenopodis]|uniref:POU-specific domain-containing protein n=1 Tax=Protopolystoma xenopodis TaxID=117903 RepID=A0A3S5AUY0_9PLAT|nr:unnamed protein product [Protopolystoma xenopodis]
MEEICAILEAIETSKRLRRHIIRPFREPNNFASFCSNVVISTSLPCSPPTPPTTRPQGRASASPMLTLSSPLHRSFGCLEGSPLDSDSSNKGSETISINPRSMNILHHHLQEEWQPPPQIGSNCVEESSYPGSMMSKDTSGEENKSISLAWKASESGQKREVCKEIASDEDEEEPRKDEKGKIRIGDLARNSEDKIEKVREEVKEPKVDSKAIRAVEEDLEEDENGGPETSLLVIHEDRGVRSSSADLIVDGVNLREIRDFARIFKMKRLSLGLTQTQIGQALTSTEGPAYSQSAICR